MTTNAAVLACTNHDPDGNEIDAIDATFYRRAFGNTLVHPAIRYSKGLYESETVWFYNVFRPCQAEIVHIIHRRCNPFARKARTHFIIRITDQSHPFYRAGEVIDEIGSGQLVPRLCPNLGRRCNRYDCTIHS